MKMRYILWVNQRSHGVYDTYDEAVAIARSIFASATINCSILIYDSNGVLRYGVSK